MEENNRKGPGVFYAVMGVATLVVAIIGATFAFFSATANSGAGAIGGSTADLSTGALSVSATQIKFEGATLTNNNLVPAANLETIGGIKGALAANCEANNYTGCHVWKIVVNSTEDLAVANITLDLSVDAAVNTNWKYALFTGSDVAGTVEGTTASVTADAYLTTTDNATGTIGTTASPLSLELNKNLGLTGGTVDGTPSKVVYLMVYLQNIDGVQNTTDTETGTNETGTYTGTVTLNAGGESGVVATFTAVTETP